VIIIYQSPPWRRWILSPKIPLGVGRPSSPKIPLGEGGYRGIEN